MRPTANKTIDHGTGVLYRSGSSTVSRESSLRNAPGVSQLIKTSLMGGSKSSSNRESPASKTQPPRTRRSPAGKSQSPIPKQLTPRQSPINSKQSTISSAPSSKRQSPISRQSPTTSMQSVGARRLSSGKTSPANQDEPEVSSAITQVKGVHSFFLNAPLSVVRLSSIQIHVKTIKQDDLVLSYP